MEFKFLFSTSSVLSYSLGLYHKVLDVIDHVSVGKRRPQIHFSIILHPKETAEVCKSEHFPPS